MVKGGGTQVLACSVCTKCVLLCFVNARNYKGTSGQHVKPTVQRGRYCTLYSSRMYCVTEQYNFLVPGSNLGPVPGSNLGSVPGSNPVSVTGSNLCYCPGFESRPGS